MSVCLVILFNHSYPQNLPVLRKIYSGRFNRLVFLMPFYRGSDPDVIPVYGHSYTFQDYLVQAYARLKGPFSHYVVVGDDLLLNPALREDTILDALCCDAQTSYIKELLPISPDTTWAQRHGYLKSLACPGIFLRPLLPNETELEAAYKRYGLQHKAPIRSVRTYSKVGFWYIVSRLVPMKLAARSRKLTENKKLLTSHIQSVARSYSDFVVIAATNMDDFIHYCGVLSSIRLFVEMTIPTALILAGATIRQERDISYHGVETWSKEANLTASFTARQGVLDFKTYFSAHPKALYVHPVKISNFSSIL